MSTGKVRACCSLFLSSFVFSHYVPHFLLSFWLYFYLHRLLYYAYGYSYSYNYYHYYLLLLFLFSFSIFPLTMLSFLFLCLFFPAYPCPIFLSPPSVSTLSLLIFFCPLLKCFPNPRDEQWTFWEYLSFFFDELIPSHPFFFFLNLPLSTSFFLSLLPSSSPFLSLPPLLFYIHIYIFCTLFPSTKYF